MSQYWTRKIKVSVLLQRLLRYFKVSYNIIEIFQNFNKHFYLDNFDDEHEGDGEGQDNDEERESRHQESTDARPLLALWQTLSSSGHCQVSQSEIACHSHIVTNMSVGTTCFLLEWRNVLSWERECQWMVSCVLIWSQHHTLYAIKFTFILWYILQLN